jgi:alpha-1,3-glucosyltransferase
VSPYLPIQPNVSAKIAVTRGLVGDTTFAVLPNISPRTTFLLTLTFQLVCRSNALLSAKTDSSLQVCLIKLFLLPKWEIFIGAITLCGYASFLFGWHVHEKAILLVMIPFSLIAMQDRRYLGAFRPLAVAGHISLFPLLFTAAEFPIKTVYTIFWLMLVLFTFNRLAPV